MNATYTKLRDGTWGVKVPSIKAISGQKITVSKKSGDTKTEVIGRIIWEGDGVCICTISSGGAQRKSRSPRTGCSCGSREDGTNAYGRDNCRQCDFDIFDM